MKELQAVERSVNKLTKDPTSVKFLTYPYSDNASNKPVLPNIFDDPKT